MTEKLSAFFQRFEASQFATYSEKYQDFLKMTRRNGILEVQMHTRARVVRYNLAGRCTAPGRTPGSTSVATMKMK